LLGAEKSGLKILSMTRGGASLTSKGKSEPLSAWLIAGAPSAKD
jgi:hypothetical protein